MLNDPPNGTKDVYDATLPWWRAAIRRRLVRIIEHESPLIARMQVCPILENEPSRPSPIAGPYTHAVVGYILRVHLRTWHAHILHDLPARVVFLRVR